MSEHVEKWVSMKDITEHLGVSRDTVLTWINEKKMPAHKIGRLWKFRVSEVDAWVKSGGSAETEKGGK
jgi:excisionase family DNA binding protein